MHPRAPSARLPAHRGHGAESTGVIVFIKKQIFWNKKSVSWPRVSRSFRWGQSGAGPSGQPGDVKCHSMRITPGARQSFLNRSVSRDWSSDGRCHHAP